MRALFTRNFWLDAVERALKTGAQFVIGGLGLGEITDAFAVDWRLGVGFGITGLALSLLTSIASAGVGQSGSPSMLD